MLEKVLGNTDMGARKVLGNTDMGLDKGPDYMELDQERALETKNWYMKEL